MAQEWNENEENEFEEQDYAFQTVRKDGKPKTIGWSIAALISGAVAAITCAFGWSSLILGICAVAFSIISRKTLGYFDGRSVTGLILGIFGVVFGAVMLVYAMTIDDEGQKFLWDWIRQMFSSEQSSGGSSNGGTIF